MALIKLIVFACFAASVCFAECSWAESHIENLKVSLENERSGEIMVVAHRACWKAAPENSILAIEECIRIGVSMVEIDVRQTRDGVLILLHDETLARTTNGQGYVANKTFDALNSLLLKNGKGGASAVLTDERIPTLEQAFAVTRDKILVNLDAKAEILEGAIKLAEEMGIADQLLIKAEWPASDTRLLSDAIQRVGYFMPKITQGDMALSQSAESFSFLHPVAFEIKARTEEWLFEGIPAMQRLGARVWINTLSESPEKAAGHVDAVALDNPAAHWGRLVELGVNMIQTDEPEALIEFLNSNR